MHIKIGITGISYGMLYGLLTVFLFLELVTQVVSGAAYNGKPSLSLKVSLMKTQSGYAPSFGAEIRLQCHIKAYPHIDAKNTVWKFNNSVLYTGHKYTLYKRPQMGSVEEVTMILTIHHINSKDLGSYTCDAKNSDGMYKHATIKIKPMGRNDIDFEVYPQAPDTHGRGRIGGPTENEEENVTTTQKLPTNGAGNIRAFHIGFITFIGLQAFHML